MTCEATIDGNDQNTAAWKISRREQEDVCISGAIELKLIGSIGIRRLGTSSQRLEWSALLSGINHRRYPCGPRPWTTKDDDTTTTIDCDRDRIRGDHHHRRRLHARRITLAPDTRDNTISVTGIVGANVEVVITLLSNSLACERCNSQHYLR